MTGHEQFAEVTRALCAEAGLVLPARPARAAAREAGTAGDCAFRHPHPGNECQPREHGYRAADDWRERGVLVR